LLAGHRETIPACHRCGDGVPCAETRAIEEVALSRRILAACVAGWLVIVAGCSNGDAPSSRASARPSARVSRQPTEPPIGEASPSAATSAAAVTGSPDPSICVETLDPAVVVVTIEDFSFEPDVVEAETGEVITFMNAGFESHNATLDSGACAIPTIETAKRDGLVFLVPGRYAFHCTVHSWMTGTIEISPSDDASGEPAAVAPGADGDRSVDLVEEQRGA
jgi:plastocyanin